MLSSNDIYRAFLFVLIREKYRLLSSMMLNFASLQVFLINSASVHAMDPYLILTKEKDHKYLWSQTGDKRVGNRNDFQPFCYYHSFHSGKELIQLSILFVLRHFWRFPGPAGQLLKI